ncbi:CHAT domain-containing protein [Nonomuraea sp. NBC_01738]|uniref:CHAT domain-containing protein n=1 Tax=Nonomuraea sp. NBC_01738 TaxID=2976003 RepID=UPI002E0F9A01|nr:CHAT domain-containing protein [Nonomuraea sp. NBC_01738]
MSLPRVRIAVRAGLVEVTCDDRAVAGPYAMKEVAAGPELLARVRGGATTAGDGAVYGRALFRALLEPAWEQITALAAVRAAGGAELALCWPPDSDLHGWLWEAMHDGDHHLAARPDLLLAITRLVPGAAGPEGAQGRAPRVLFAAGDALTDEVIRPGAMFMGLIRALDAEGLAVTRVAQVSAEELADVCAAFRPDIVHVVAHGSVDEDGRSLLRLRGHRADSWAGAAELATALTAGGPVRAVVLSACHTGDAFAAELVAAGIPLVSAMAGEISERACRLYARKLTGALAGGGAVVEASAKGRRAAMVGASRDHLDWARPALFLAEGLQPGASLVDPVAARRLVELADELKLRRQPLHIGRDHILDQVDRLFTDRLGFLVACRDGTIQRTGGTRLLREAGFRLLRDGHVPVFIGPFSGSALQTPRELLAVLHFQAAEVAATLGAPPPPLRGVRPAGFDEALERIDAFAGEPGPFALTAAARRTLAEDLGALAASAADLGEPFGPHTRVVVLIDSLHAFGEALTGLLSMIRATGLGTAQRPVPVVATASLSEDQGRLLKSFCEREAGAPGFAFPELTGLGDEEAVLGYQWVLLHPWLRHREPEFRRVYVAARGARADKLRDGLRVLKGDPTVVEDTLYMAAQILAVSDLLVTDDDEAVYAEYLERFG